ncbi:carboxylesterase [Geothermobacter ehrlichii]|uniref:Carboxylesterase n=1 Tax=Geothermobacter ehrlichii TaxID=213224 RepID=A0A5D3WL03_9BACT|nr:alpha/beta fold hydrolase [Geothermobacter ehrlichii]TYO97517.1 carboxylesterase [Geothermobacter ehrlichii]
MSESIDHYIAACRRRGREEGVSRPENLPFFLAGEKRKKAAVLLVHGFTASPYEMRLPAEYLARRGHPCLAVRLPGHGTSPEDLARQSWRNWLQVVEEGLQLLSAEFGPPAAVGSSTGSLLLLRAAAGGSPITRLALCSPFLRVRHRLARLAWLLRHLRPYQHHPKVPAVAPFFYERRPLAGIAEIHWLLADLRPRLQTIELPCLILGSLGDQTIDPESTEQLFRQLGSREKAFHRYGPEAPHVLTLPDNPHLADTLQRIGRFLDGTDQAGEETSRR